MSFVRFLYGSSMSSCANTLRRAGVPLRGVAGAALVVAAFGAGSAFAQPAEKSAADLESSAKAALASGDVPGACDLFGKSYEAAKKAGADAAGPKPGDLLFELADCHERQGYATLAANEFDQVAQLGGANAGDAKARADKLRAAPPQQPPVPPPPGAPLAPGPGDAFPPPPQFPPDQPAIRTERTEAPTRIGDFMDTRLAWTFGDDDVLHQTGQAYPLSPDANIGDRSQYRLFFDNLNSRFNGRENLTHLVLYKKMPGFIPNLDTEAALVLRFDLASLASNSGNLNQAIYDAGSFIRIFYHTSHSDEPEATPTGIGLTFWPIDTDRFRLGYLYDISWGGTNASINQSIFPRIVGSSPGAKLSFESPRFNAYVGFKTAEIVQVQQTLTPGTSDVESVNVGQSNYGLLTGLGGDLHQMFHMDGAFGYFTQGKFDLPDVEGKPVYTFGGSARAVVHTKGMPIGQSVDFLLYRNDPNKPQQIFLPEVYRPGAVDWNISFEGDLLAQNLKNFDVAGATKLQPAFAAALQGNLKAGYFRASLSGIYRDLNYVVRSQPGFIPFETIPKDAIVNSEIFVAGSADYYFAGPRLTPGLALGVQLPATFESKSVNLGSAPIARTVVVRSQGNIAILPLNTDAKPIIQARLSLKWDLSPILSAIGWIQYVYDNNGTFVERDPTEGTVALRTFISPSFLGLGTSVQARF